MIFRLIGVTSWTLDVIARLTMPQLELVLRGQGQILYPRLKPQLDAEFAQVSSQPNKDNPGGVSDVRKIILDHQQRLAHPEEPPTREERERATAYWIRYAAYLPAEQPEQASDSEPIEGLPPATARAVLAYGAAGQFPPDIWAEDVAPLLRGIKATAALQ